MAGSEAWGTVDTGTAAAGEEEITGDDGTAASTEAEGGLGDVGEVGGEEEVSGFGGSDAEATGRVGGDGFAGWGGCFGGVCGGVFEADEESSTGDGGFFWAGEDDTFGGGGGGDEVALDAGVDEADGFGIGCGAVLFELGGELVCRLIRIGAVSSVACSCSQSLRNRREEPVEIMTEKCSKISSFSKATKNVSYDADEWWIVGWKLASNKGRDEVILRRKRTAFPEEPVKVLWR